MSECKGRSKADLKKAFMEGATPSQEDFCNLIESTINKEDDNVQSEENLLTVQNLTVNGDLKLPNVAESDDENQTDQVIVIGPDKIVKALPYQVGDITSVYGGEGLEGHATSGPAVLKVKASKGIQVDSSGVEVKVGNGLEVDNDGVKVDSGNGITVNSSGVHVDGGDGIIVNSTGVKVDPGKGITVDSSGVNVNAGNGIIVNSTQVKVDPGNGIVVNDSGVNVNGGNGIVVSSTDVKVDPGNGIIVDASGVSVDPGNGIIVDASGVSVDPGNGIIVDDSGVHLDDIISIDNTKVGIGLNQSPGSTETKLEVNGVIRANGFEFSNGEAIVNNSGGNSPWEESDSDIVYNAGNVGIGTSDKTLDFSKLTVVSTEYISIFADCEKEAGTAILGYNTAKTGKGIGVYGRTDSETGYAVSGKTNVGTSGFFSSKNGNGLIVELGNVGIGLSNPSEKFHVDGNTIIEGTVRIGNLALTDKYKLDVDGLVRASGNVVLGLDYAEFFESSNGKAIPLGTSVVIEGGKIRPAKKNEVPIGIISVNPGILGGVHSEWPKKYERDEFGNQILEEAKEPIMVQKTKSVKKERQQSVTKKIKEKVMRTEVKLKGKKYVQVEVAETITREVEEPVFKEVKLYNASGSKVVGVHQVPVMENYTEEEDVLDESGNPVMVKTQEFNTVKRPKLNPEYDSKKEYVPRSERPEWNCVGLMGQIAMIKEQPTAPTWVKMNDISDKVELWLVK